MELRDRLKAMGVRPRVAGISTPAPLADDLRQTLDDKVQSVTGSQEFASLSATSSQRTIDRALPGNWHETADGPCYAVERRYPVGQRRGPVTLGHLLTSKPQTLWDAGRASVLRDMDPRGLLFLDTETTGLSGGTGTYVFLVGVAYFSEAGDELVVRQYFLSDVGAERPLLLALNELMSRFKAVVTFNGKSFDWPLLETRYIYTRLRPALKDPPHLDLLGPSRRLWKDRLSSCSLEMLEQHVLGVKRGFDVPGWRIPALYFQYLRAGHIGHILPVFSHNEHDLLTLVALAGHVGRILDEPDEADLHAAELFGLGKLYEDLGRFTESLRAYERGLRLEPSPELRDVALRRLSYLYKHLQQREEAVAIWAALVEEGTHLTFPYLELAKHYEHRAKDFPNAEKYAMMAWERASNVVERAELEHRLRRVKGKGERSVSGTP